MRCSDAFELMHSYLDNEMEEGQQKLLKSHLEQCPKCAEHFLSLEKTEMLLQGIDQVSAPGDFTSSVMNRLPKESSVVVMRRWLKAHPFIVAASLFLFMMMGSFSSIYSGTSNDFSLASNDAEKLVIKDNNHVIVPKGTVIHGDIVIRNGSIDVQGEVQGDVVVIDGKATYASTAEVSGQLKKVDDLFDRMAYGIKSGIAAIFGKQ